MGRLYYSEDPAPVEIEDRTLAHIRLVVMNKLRRGEGFMFETDAAPLMNRRDLWMDPSISLQFHFTGSKRPQINPRWVDALMEAANGPAGLRVVPEPTSS